MLIVFCGFSLEEKEWLTSLVTDLLAFDLNSPPYWEVSVPVELGGRGGLGVWLLFRSYPRIRLQDPVSKGRMDF